MSLIIILNSYLFNTNVDSKKLLYLRGSALDFKILKKYLLNKIKLKEDDLNLASFLYLTGYYSIARSIYKRKILKNKNARAGKLYFSAKNFKAIGHTAYISTFIREALLNGAPYPTFYFDEKKLYDNPRLIEAYVNSFPQFFSENSFDGERVDKPYEVNLGFIETDQKYLWFDEWGHKIEKLWDSSCLRDKVIELDQDYVFKCKSILEDKFGVQPNGKIIVIHIRESSSSKLMDLRDSEPSTYKEAIKSLLDRGFHVFRIGIDVRNFDFKIRDNRYHDMTQHKDIQNIVDLYLFSNCYAFIGTGSGPANVAAQVFKRPALFINIAPLRSRVPSHNQVVLPKTYRRVKKGQQVSLEQRIGNSLGHLESKSALKKRGIISKDNTESQIKKATLEFIESIDDAGIIKSFQYINQDPIALCGCNEREEFSLMKVNISSYYAH